MRSAQTSSTFRRLAAALSVTAFLSSSIAWAAPPSLTEEVKPYLCDQAFGLVSLDLAALRASKPMQGLPLDDILASDQGNPWNARLADAARATIVMYMEVTEDGPNDMQFVVVRLRSPFDKTKHLTQSFLDGEETQVDGRPSFAAANGLQLTARVVEPDLLVVGPPRAWKFLAGKTPGQGPLLPELAKAQPGDVLTVLAVVDPIREVAQNVAAGAGDRVPLPLKPLLTLPNNLKTASLSVNLDRNPLASLRLIGVDGPASNQLEQAAKVMLEFGKGMYGALREENPVPEQIPGLQSAANLIDKAVSDAAVSRAGDQISVALNVSDELPKIIQGLGPAIAAARIAAKRAQRINNMRQMQIALLNYEGVKGRMELARVDADGKPTVSWRVAVLPYLDRNDLYPQFKLDEPWDSPANLKMLAQMPGVFGVSPDHKTRIQAFIGGGAMFEDKPPYRKLSVKDGTSNTIMLIETSPEKAVPWTSPENLVFDPQNPLASLGKIPPEGLLVGFADGSVRTLPPTITASQFRALVTASGGEAVEPLD